MGKNGISAFDDGIPYPIDAGFILVVITEFLDHGIGIAQLGLCQAGASDIHLAVKTDHINDLRLYIDLFRPGFDFQKNIAVCLGRWGRLFRFYGDVERGAAVIAEADGRDKKAAGLTRHQVDIPYRFATDLAVDNTEITVLRAAENLEILFQRTEVGVAVDSAFGFEDELEGFVQISRVAVRIRCNGGRRGAEKPKHGAQ